ncbi:MAG: hypothetical protein JSW69_08330 [Deltaproteobacteria bacterium]|nr:MAG: hypothetical protein JSW69_08330 [Deltaproteobacteria bacterium]
MKKMFIFIIIFLAAAAMAATDPETDNGKDKPEEKVLPVPAIKEEVQEKSSGGESWPRPFVPSEKIGADSVVSFPADI